MNNDSEITNELNSLNLENMVNRHSFFQLKYFLLGKEPTHQARLWQCLREIDARKDSWESILLEIDDVKDDLKIFDLSLERLELKKQFKNLHNEKIHEIKISKLKRKKFCTDKNLDKLIIKKKNLLEEIDFFLKSYKNLEQAEALKPFDDLESQKDYWGQKLLQKLNLRKVMGVAPDLDVLETILLLPDDVPIKQQTLLEINKRHEFIINKAKEIMGD
jgi:hypothetical protein